MIGRLSQKMSQNFCPTLFYIWNVRQFYRFQTLHWKRKTQYKIHDLGNQKITRPFPKTISEFDHRKCHFYIGFLTSLIKDIILILQFWIKKNSSRMINANKKQAWSSLIKLEQAKPDQAWASLIKTDQDWPKLIKHPQAWSSLIKPHAW